MIELKVHFICVPLSSIEFVGNGKLDRIAETMLFA